MLCYTMLAPNKMLAESLQHPYHQHCLSLSGLKQLAVLLGVRLFNISLGNLLHHEVAINDHIFSELAAGDTPFARDGQDADRRLSVDEGVDAVGDVCEGELVCCLLVSVRIWRRGCGVGNVPGQWASCR
jgi:hypothetical protein